MTDNLALANGVASWLQNNGCTVTIFTRRDKVEVSYTLQDDIKPQPCIIVRQGRISIPAGSQQAVVMAFLRFMTRGT